MIRHIIRSLAVAAALATPTAWAAAPSVQSHDLYFRNDHALVPNAPATNHRAQDLLSVSPGAVSQSYPTFSSLSTLEALLAASSVEAEQLMGGTTLLFVRSSRKLERCVDFELSVLANGTEIANTKQLGVTLRHGLNAIALGFDLDDAARAELETKALQLVVSARIGLGCKAATLRLHYDSKGRPSHVSMLQCSGPASTCDSPAISDTDGDGFPDGADNCPSVANPDQTDTDDDGEGDACDPSNPGGGGGDPTDDDGDGVPNDQDNCAGVANADQADADNDGIGDVCDQDAPAAKDRDDDGVADGSDNCPQVPNPDQADADENGRGDVCECSAGAPGRCLPGGGAKRSDCLIEFNTTGPITYTRNLRRVKNLLRCTDGDPACDRDGKADGKCTFGVNVCVANKDPRFPRCAQSSVRSFEVRRPRHNEAQLRLETTLQVLGIEITRGGQVISPSLVTPDMASCTTLADLSVTAPDNFSRRAVRRSVVVRAQAKDGRIDRDRVTLECRGR